jgi:hypothetical protein
LPSKPGEHLGVHANAHQLLDWPVETSNLNVTEIDWQALIQQNLHAILASKESLASSSA